MRLIQRALVDRLLAEGAGAGAGCVAEGDAAVRHGAHRWSASGSTALEAPARGAVELRDDMRMLLRDWDERLARTPAGQRARLLDMLDGRAALDNAGNRARVRVGRIDL